MNQATIVNAYPTQVADDIGWEQYFSHKIKYKGEGIQALKSLFLSSPSNHPEIPLDLYMNGVMSPIPWCGHQEYGLVWDTSVLPITLEKSTICHAIVKMDQHRINLLKMARLTFDRVYPDGTKSLVNVILLPRVRNHLQTRRVACSTT